MIFVDNVNHHHRTNKIGVNSFRSGQMCLRWHGWFGTRIQLTGEVKYFTQSVNKDFKISRRIFKDSFYYYQKDSK
eukprot:scaffold7213_cov166-Amphora_coffeaeformis.AAC.19